MMTKMINITETIVEMKTGGVNGKKVKKNKIST